MLWHEVQKGLFVLSFCFPGLDSSNETPFAHTFSESLGIATVCEAAIMNRPFDCEWGHTLQVSPSIVIPPIDASSKELRKSCTSSRASRSSSNSSGGGMLKERTRKRTSVLRSKSDSSSGTKQPLRSKKKQSTVDQEIRRDEIALKGKPNAGATPRSVNKTRKARFRKTVPIDRSPRISARQQDLNESIGNISTNTPTTLSCSFSSLSPSPYTINARRSNRLQSTPRRTSQISPGPRMTLSRRLPQPPLSAIISPRQSALKEAKHQSTFDDSYSISTAGGDLDFNAPFSEKTPNLCLSTQFTVLNSQDMYWRRKKSENIATPAKTRRQNSSVKLPSIRLDDAIPSSFADWTNFGQPSDNRNEMPSSIPLFIVDRAKDPQVSQETPKERKQRVLYELVAINKKKIQAANPLQARPPTPPLARHRLPLSPKKRSSLLSTNQRGNVVQESTRSISSDAPTFTTKSSNRKPRGVDIFGQDIDALSAFYESPEEIVIWRRYT
jgi:hypothetical protein